MEDVGEGGDEVGVGGVPLTDFALGTVPLGRNARWTSLSTHIRREDVRFR